MEWKIIEKDGYPKKEGRYLTARSAQDSTAVRLFLFEDHFTAPVKYWSEIEPLPHPDNGH